MTDPTKPGIKTTELWMTTAVAAINTIVASVAPNVVTISLLVCLTTVAVTYLVCRTVYKVAMIKFGTGSNQSS